MRRLIALALSAALAACGDSPSPAPAPDPEPTVIPVVPPTPVHRYALQEGLEYGYEKAVSTAEANQGRAASQLVMVKFLGEHNGVLQFHTRSGDFHVIYECARPCEFIKERVFHESRVLRTERYRVTPQSVAAALVADANEGQLKTWRGEHKGKLSELWVDEKGALIWRPVAP